jgi:transcriptional regulator with XRE-family HTH domain
MRNSNLLAETVRSRREGLGLTRRSFAKKLGVKASHVASIESGRRKPSLKLVARLADILGLDRQNLLILAHPEAKKLITEASQPKRRRGSPSWQRFIRNHGLLTVYNVTDRELSALEHLSLMETIRSAKDFLTILMLIRDIPSLK